MKQKLTEEQIAQQKENKRAAEKIAAMHNTLTHLDQSMIEHYQRCHAKGSVPVNHPSGGWYNSYAMIDLLLLYLRLPENCKPFCTQPKGYRSFKASIKKGKVNVKLH